MKKGKLLALALAAGITFMGAGYAAWTDEINVNTTVSTGNLEVKIDKGDVKNYTDIYLSKKENSLQDDIENDDCWDRIETPNNSYGIVLGEPTVDDNSVTFAFDGLFPGVRASSFFKVTNTGTVPAKISSVSVICKVKEDNEEEYKAIDATGITEDDLILYSKLKVRYRFWLKRNDGTSEPIQSEEVLLSALQDELNERLVGTTLKNGEYLSAGDGGRKELHVYLPEDSFDGDEGENQCVQISVKFNFIQSNLDK